jgi:uncharacterized protein (TIGR00730 family)
MTELSICVFCASSSRIDPKYVELAAEVGTELARRGHSLVTGGATVSSMGAVAAAARAGGARTVGVIPVSMDDGELPDHGNDELVVTPDMRSRKGEMDRRSDAFLVLAGGLGTLEELFEIWTSRVLGMHDKPLVILDPHGLYDPLRALMEHLNTEGFARPTALAAVSWTTSVQKAFALLEGSEEQVRPTPEERAEAQI